MGVSSIDGKSKSERFYKILVYRQIVLQTNENIGVRKIQKHIPTSLNNEHVINV